MEIGICDDEQLCCDEIVQLIQQNFQKIKNLNCYTFHSGEDFLKHCETHPVFDIAFLDIEMPSMNGLNLANKVLKANKTAIIFFMTSHANYISDAFRLNTFQFLLKPIKSDVFCFDFERALKKHKILHTQYLIKDRQFEIPLKYHEILYIEVYGKHLHIHTAEKSYECVGKISVEEQKLSSYNFVRCHQSYLVNMTHIKSIEKNKIILSNGQQIIISRKMKNNVLNAFTQFMAGHII